MFAIDRAGTLHLAYLAPPEDPDPDLIDVLTYAWRTSGADGIDHDCDGQDSPWSCLDDFDGDGERSPDCGGADCNDMDPSVLPDASDEAGDGTDRDCDGTDGTDRDHDGAVDANRGGTDCDDSDPAVRTGAFDPPGDCLDQDCDGLDGPDEDLDGRESVGCGGDDCDDADATVFPGAPDLADDGHDQDCDEVDGVDLDRDAWASVESGGEDCDDSEPSVHPHADDGASRWRFVAGCCEAAVDATSLVLTVDGSPWIAFHDLGEGRIRILGLFSGQWERVDVDDVPDDELSPSMALDPTGHAHVLYRESDADELRHATDASGTWTHEPVDASGTPGHFASVAVDTSGWLHVATMDTWDRDTLEYATNSGGVWVVETVDSGGATGHDCSIALDSVGHAHISYAESGDEDLRYATNAGGDWIVETIDDGPARGHHSSLALDAFGALHVVYRQGDHDADPDGALWYATNSSGAWVTESVDTTPDAGRDTSIAVGEDGAVHATYVAGGELRYATGRSGDWVTTTVAAANCSGTSLSIDRLGFRHASYRNGNTGIVAYATDAPLADGIDQDCDGADGVDADGDRHASLWTAGDDCLDDDASVHPGAADPAGDGIDQDCSGSDGP